MAIKSNQFPFNEPNLEGDDSFLCDKCMAYGYCRFRQLNNEPEDHQITTILHAPPAPKEPKELEDLLPQLVSFNTFATNDWPLVNEVLDAFHTQQYAAAIQLTEALMAKYDGWMLQLITGLAAYQVQDYKKAYLHLSQFETKKQLNTIIANELKELLDTCFVLQELELCHHSKPAGLPIPYNAVEPAKSLVTI